MPTPSTPRHEVRKAVEAIHTTGSLSLLERKLANILLLNAYDDLLIKARHEIPVALLMAMLGWEDSGNRDDLKQALRNIKTTELEFDLLAKGNKRKKWATTSLLAWAEIEGAACRYEYAPSLAEMLAKPEIYAIINMQVQRQLGSAYALNLYENCVRYVGTQSTGAHPVEVWRKVLGAQSSTYDEFKFLNKRVIDKAVADVNKFTDITVTPHFTRGERRRVTHIAFEVQPKQEGQSPLFSEGDRAAELLASELGQRALALGVGAKLVVQWLDDDYDRARKVIDITEQRVRLGRVDDPAGYVTHLYNEGQLDTAPIIAQQAQAKADQAAADAAAEQARAADDKRIAQRRKQLKALTVDQRVTYAQAFAATPEGQGMAFDPATGEFLDPKHRPAFRAWLLSQLPG